MTDARRTLMAQAMADKLTIVLEFAGEQDDLILAARLEDMRHHFRTKYQSTIDPV